MYSSVLSDVNNYYKDSNIYIYNSTLCKSVSLQTLMSVVMEHTIALKYVLTLMEATRVDVMMVIIYTLIMLLVMVCTKCVYT